jgi:ribosomal protein S18 acetylase RimI-like enzyme
VLELSQGLPVTAFEAVRALEHRVIAVDGGRLKLEWGTLSHRPIDEVNDLLWWDGPRLLGFLGLYCFDGRNVELVGMVDPEARRSGIATKLLDAALVLCRERAYASVLLVTPRNSDGGRSLALARDGVLDHSEYAMLLTDAPVGQPSDLKINIRMASVNDAPVVTQLLASAFGYAPDDLADRLANDPPETHVVEIDGVAVGTLRVTRNGDVGGIYGFAVDPSRQGRGIGREVLRRMCSQLFDDGVKQVGLEVATQNEGALGLYTSIGFRQVTTEDYFALAVLNR